VRVLPSRAISGMGRVGNEARTFLRAPPALGEVGGLVGGAQPLGALPGDVDLVVTRLGSSCLLRPEVVGGAVLGRVGGVRPVRLVKRGCQRRVLFIPARALILTRLVGQETPWPA
jgi:hypothetical protein